MPRLASDYSNVSTTYQAKALLVNMQNDKLTIQEVAQATGLNADTVRYYEQMVLIHSIGRMVVTLQLGADSKSRDKRAFALFRGRQSARSFD